MSSEKKEDELATVRIRKQLKETAENWLNTEYAKNLGFSTVANFMNVAARDALIKYRGPVFTDLVRYENNYELYDVVAKSKIYININKQDSNLKCNKCDAFVCDHILFVWNTPTEVIHLKQMDFPNPLDLEL